MKTALLVLLLLFSCEIGRSNERTVRSETINGLQIALSISHISFSQTKPPDLSISFLNMSNTSIIVFTCNYNLSITTVTGDKCIILTSRQFIPEYTSYPILIQPYKSVSIKTSWEYSDSLLHYFILKPGKHQVFLSYGNHLNRSSIVFSKGHEQITLQEVLPKTGNLWEGQLFTPPLEISVK